MTSSALNDLGRLIWSVTMGDRISEAIKGCKKSQATIARECGVTPGAVTQWVKGQISSLKAETALALEVATGYRAYWLLHGKGAKKVAEKETIWPFPLVPMELFLSLDDQRRGFVQSKMMDALNEVLKHDRALLDSVSTKSAPAERKRKAG